MMPKQKGREVPHCCPYCDEEVRAADFPWCQACGLTVGSCPKCKKPVQKDDEICSYCGTEIKG